MQPLSSRLAAVLLAAVSSLSVAASAPDGDPPNGVPGERLPTHAVARIGTTRLRHGSQVSSVAYSPDGRKVISTDGHSVGVWDAKSGREISFRMLREQYRCWPRLSPDGSLIACRVEDGALGVQDAETGKVRSRFPLKEGRAHNLLFSKDNRWLTSTDDEGVVSLWDVTAGKLVWTKPSPQKGFDSGPAFTPDGTALMHATREGHLFLWDVRTGKEIWHVEPVKEKNREYHLNGLDISPDGEVAAVMHRWSRIELREVKTGKLVREFEASGSWSGPRFSPDGKQLLCSVNHHHSSNVMLFWDVATGKLARKLQGDRTGEPESFAVSADGKFLAVGGWDHAVHLWDLGTEKAISTPVLLGGDVSARLLTDGKTILTTCRCWANISSGTVDPNLRFWDLTGNPGKLKTFDTRRVYDFTINPAGDVIAAAKGLPLMVTHRVPRNGELQSSLSLADLATGTELLQIADLRCEIHELGFSPDGRFLFISADTPGPNDADYHRRPVVQVWQRTAPAKLEKKADIASIDAWSCRFVCAPDSRWVGVATGTGYDVHDCDTGKLFRRLPLTGAVRAVSPSGRVLACTDDDKRTAFLVELATGKTICKLDCDPAFLVRPRFAFSADGRVVASALNTETIVLWDALTGKRIGALGGHSGGIVSLEFAPDGRFLVSGSSDTTVLIWDYRAALAKTEGQTGGLSGEQLERLWGDLQSDDADRGYRAIAALVRAPDPAITFLRKTVSPATKDEQGRIQKWVDDVAAGDEVVRTLALAELSLLGTQAEPAIRNALRGKPTVETQRRLEAVLGTPGSAPAPVWLATQRALEVLERIGTPDARAVLEGLSKGAPESPRTQEARRALDRLLKRGVP